MKLKFLVVLTSFLLSCQVMCGSASADNQYPNGLEGIKAATVPPPGTYLRVYNYYYTSDRFIGQDGKKVPIEFDADLYALAPRLLWVSDIPILGGTYAADAIVPLIYKDINAGGAGGSEFGFFDPILEPFVISWHGERWDAVFALGGFIPVGDYDAGDPSSIGSGFWTQLTTLGTTLYLDPEKTWSASILSRYEVHSDQRDLDYRPGDDFHFEWSVAKNFCEVINAGVSGYANWQVTQDTGSDAPAAKDKDRVFAVGPEITYLVPALRTVFKAAYLLEFEARDRPEGMVANITLTTAF